MDISLFMESFKENLLCLFGDNLLFRKAPIRKLGNEGIGNRKTDVAWPYVDKRMQGTSWLRTDRRREQETSIS